MFGETALDTANFVHGLERENEELARENERLKRELASLKQPEIKVLYFTAKEVENAFKKMAAEDGFEVTNVKADISWQYEYDEWGMNKYVKTGLKGIEVTVERKQ